MHANRAALPIVAATRAAHSHLRAERESALFMELKMAGPRLAARLGAILSAFFLANVAAQAQTPFNPGVAGCQECHRADGTAGPEGVDLTGLGQDYLVQQLQDFRAGLRRSATPKSLSDADIAAAAAYYAAIPARSRVRVVESDSAPRVGEQEPLGRRIVEIPENAAPESKARVVAYVPVGALAAGKILAETGGGKTTPCATCHERGLKGDGLFPPLAGRSPSYIARQLSDFKNGARAGANGVQMKPIVARLNADDMMLLAAYIASLPSQ